jgi:cysteine desulfurase
VGALYKRADLEIYPTQTGGGQEHKMRAGTSNVPYIVGLATAFHLAQTEQEIHNQRLTHLRDKINQMVVKTIPGSRLTGHLTRRLPNHSSFAFEGIDGNDLLIHLDAAGFSCSSGSACKVGDPRPSEVLEAIGLPPQFTRGSLRVTLGRETQPDEVDLFLETLPELVSMSQKVG